MLFYYFIWRVFIHYLSFRFKVNFKMHMRKGCRNQSKFLKSYLLSYLWYTDAHAFNEFTLFFPFLLKVLGTYIWGLPQFDCSSSGCGFFCLSKVKRRKNTGNTFYLSCLLLSCVCVFSSEMQPYLRCMCMGHLSDLDERDLDGMCLCVYRGRENLLCDSNP